MGTRMETITDTQQTIPIQHTKKKHKHTASKSQKSPRVNIYDRPYKHVYAFHAQPRTSCLSSGSEVTPSFVGFKNLMVLVLLSSNLRLILENYRKYGVLICIGCHEYSRKDVLLGAILYLSVPCHLFIAYSIEYLAAQRAKAALGQIKRAEGQGAAERKQQQQQQQQQQHQVSTIWTWIALAHTINATLNLIITSSVVYWHIFHPAIGTVCEIHAVIVWLKTCSYAFTNRDLRHAYLSSNPATAGIPALYAQCPYPQNITLRNLTYFWWAPTLVYQPVYPRTDRIRWRFVAARGLEAIGLSIAIWVASAQYAAPLLRNSLSSMSALDIPTIAERLMKLSSISLFCWLAGFFALFQSFLNLLAEITCFADREFYSDWWNSPSVRSYWSSWNKPVYQFMKRHVFSPLVGRGMHPALAAVVVFVFSGVLHELLVGIPTHNIIGVAFLGMVAQLPLIAITDVITQIKGMGGKTTGNVIFWVSFVLVGQPLAALLYFFAWHAKYGSASKMGVLVG